MLGARYMVEITYPMVLSTLQTIALIVGIAYYLFIMRNSQRNQELALKAQEQAIETRQTQIFMRLYEQINDADTYTVWAQLVNMEIDFDDFLQKYDSTADPVHFGKRAHLWFTFNTVGELLLMGIINPELIFRLTLPPMVITMWEGWEHIIREIRVRENSPELWNGFEHLYNEMVRLRKERGYPERIYPRPSDRT
jgi:hypothetical protein